jgi:LPXTG-site transpeptidase (sortase) family protein
VFWDLGSLGSGDVVSVYLTDGTRLEYQVTNVATFDDADAPVSDIVGQTPGDAVTLITCAGSFDSTSRLYDQRLVVRAVRVAQDTP